MSPHNSNGRVPVFQTGNLGSSPSVGSKYSFCESVHAGPLSPWHIRKLTEVGKMLGGGIDTTTLCKRVKQGWDLEVDINEFHLKNNTCEDCLKAYLARNLKDLRE